MTSSCEPNCFRDEGYHEDLELSLQLCSVMESDVASYELKRVTVPRDLASSGTIEERALAAKVAFEALAGSIAKEISDLEEGQTHATRAEELEEKLRCSICMDRPKNVVFACGYTCCDQCASEWKQCPNKCEGLKGHKPVKHTFKLYL